MTRLPFTTDDVREQCAHFGDAPLAHPLPVKHLLLMCQHIDDLETERTKLIANGKKQAAAADKFELWWRDQRNERIRAEARISAAMEVVWTAATYATVEALAEDFRRALLGEELS